ncbi:virginiamycin B lyase family protein [Deinococcus depolymerans]|uniref:Uncharacterized protein n=1 Tax=Deinococcus depolymerans TaxID=392408 RepID=A0ABP3M0N4_9DEIO
MTRSLTPPVSAPPSGGRRPVRPLLAALLGSLLAACGSGPAASGAGSAPGSSLVVSLDRVPVSGPLAQPGTLRLQGVPASGVSVTVQAAPGLSVTPGAAVASGSDALLPLTVTGTGRGTVTLNVRAGNRSQDVTVRVLGSEQHVPAAPYLAGAVRSQGDRVLLRATVSADAASRHALLAFDPADRTFTPLPFPVAGFETITSHAVNGPDVWVAVRGVNADGSFLVRRSADGATRRYLAGTVETLNHVTPLADGRVAFTAYGQERVLLLDPASGTIQAVATQGAPDSVTLGADGRLYFARRGDSPAIVALNLADGAARTYPVGTPGVSVPASLTAAPDGTLWFTESRTGTLRALDPVSGTQRQVTLPAGRGPGDEARPGDLTVAPDGTVWATDTAHPALLRVLPGESSAAALTLPAGPTAGPRALHAAPDGSVWFETGGTLARLR